MIDKKIEKSESQFDNRQSSRQAFNRDAYRGGLRDWLLINNSLRV